MKCRYTDCINDVYKYGKCYYHYGSWRKEHNTEEFSYKSEYDKLYVLYEELDKQNLDLKQYIVHLEKKLKNDNML